MVNQVKKYDYLCKMKFPKTCQSGGSKGVSRANDGSFLWWRWVEVSIMSDSLCHDTFRALLSFSISTARFWLSNFALDNTSSTWIKINKQQHLA